MSGPAGGQAAPPQPLSRLKGALLLIAALVVLVIAAAGLSEAFLAPSRDLHRGTIYGSGYQIVHIRPNGQGAVQTVKVAAVKLRLDDGTRHTVESNELFNLYNAAPKDLQVDVQVDAYDAPERVRYQGKWYGAGPPVWFWIGFGVVLLSVGGLLARAGIRRLRRPAPAAG